MIENSCIENVKSCVTIENSCIENIKNCVMIEKIVLKL